MKLSEIKKDVEKYIDQEITAEGWIRQARFTKNVGFIELNDGTIFKNLQVVVGKELENFEDLQKEHLSASLKVKGILVKTNNAKQAFELQAKSVEVLGHSDEKFPIQKQKQSLEYMRTIPHLRVRTNTYRAVFRLRSKLAFALHKFFQERGFIYLNAPLITASDTEGAGEMFQVTTQNLAKPDLDKSGKVDYSKDFFGKKSYLTVSGQLEAEDYALALSNIYTFGPTFRAEESNTPRHAAEFWMLEPELAFADYNVCMDVAEEMMKYMIEYVLENCKDEIEFFNERIDDTLIERLTKIKDAKFARITYTDAIEKLQEADVDFEYPVKWGMDLQTEHELSLIHI